jgi:hypothetical protein
MTSYRQFEANRRNAGKSTGPVTEEGKRRSRCNAVRHGLTAETVIGALEDAKDYKAFEAAIIADYDAQSAVERELVLRLASLLWRLRRATTGETSLFDMQAEQLRDFRQARQRKIIYAMFSHADPIDADRVIPCALIIKVDAATVLPRPIQLAAFSSPWRNASPVPDGGDAGRCKSSTSSTHSVPGPVDDHLQRAMSQFIYDIPIFDGHLFRRAVDLIP